MEQRLETRISGRVQGVSFRYHTQRQAMDMGLTGWVRNCSDGTVEAVAEGPSSKLEEFLAFLHQGPRHARVEDVRSQWGEAQGEFTRFDIRY